MDKYLHFRRLQRITQLKALIVSLHMSAQDAPLQLAQLTDVPGGKLTSKEIKQIVK